MTRTAAAAATKTCQVCRGAGVCDCPGGIIEEHPTHKVFQGCNGRYWQLFPEDAGPCLVLHDGRTLEVFPGNTADPGAGPCLVLHDGRTCHKCAGAGVRPVGVTPPYLRAAARDERRAVVAEHLATVGPVCPGFGRPPHGVDPADLTADHREPRARGGAPTGRANLGILCRSCNARKSHRVRSAPSRLTKPATAVHACRPGCEGELHVSEVVAVGTINRDHAQRVLRRRYAMPALFVEDAHASSAAVAGRTTEVRNNPVGFMLVRDAPRPEPPPPVVWLVTWRE